MKKIIPYIFDLPSSQFLFKFCYLNKIKYENFPSLKLNKYFSTIRKVDLS